MTDVEKEKLNPFVEEYRRIKVNQNSFRVLSILYITNFCEIRKINYFITYSITFYSSKFPEK